MRRYVPMLLSFACVAILLVPSSAQPPGGKGGKDQDYSNSPIVTKMMAFNSAKDGKLTKEQLTDPRLHRLFDLADTNKDGIVTKEELMALAAKLDAEWGQGGGGKEGKGPKDKGPKDKGPGDKGGKGGKGPGGFGPPQPGQVLPTFIQEQLNLSADQRKQLEELQKDVDQRLSKILTDEQMKQLKDMQNKGPGKGFGGGKGPGGN
jgi:hypothetical protein